MTVTTRLLPVFLATIITTFYNTGSLAADEAHSTIEIRPPAGQVCPQGSFVIGFDNESNIRCSGACGNHVLNNGEACDDGNTTSGDGCSATCQSETPTAVMREEDVAAEPTPTPPVSKVTVVEKPVISKIKPSWAVFGAREVIVTIIGTGFTGETVVLFSGTSYTPSVNHEGTELKVTLATRQLVIGRHPVTVSNGPGLETTLKKGLEVF